MTDADNDVAEEIFHDDDVTDDVETIRTVVVMNMLIAV